MFLFWWIALAAFLEMQKLAMAECPLDLSGSNFTLAASICSNQDDRGKCCRYINAFIAVAVTRYANRTGNLGVPSELSAICLKSVSETLELYGIQPNATVFCGLGTKIPVTYQCKGRTTVPEMLLSPNFKNVTQNCKGPLSLEVSCKKCLNAGIVYLHHLVGADGNMTLSTCRDATFVSIASQGDNVSAFDMASCFFGVQGLSIFPVINSEPSSPLLAPKPSVGPISAASPGHGLVVIPLKEHRNPYHLTLLPGIGIAVTGAAVLLLVVLILLIRRKSRELKGSESDSPNGTSWKSFPQPNRKSQEGPSSMFRRFSYKETKKATGNFGTIIGRGGFGTVYKAQFKDGFVAAVKRMDKVSEQGEDEFCREMELLGRLHHRHLVSLRGFCVEKHERFLMYEYMENGSLKDHLHSPGKTPLGWQTRIQIAIDVANALRDLHGILSKAPFLGWVVRPKFHVRDVSLRTSADRFLNDCLLLLPLDFQPSPGFPATKLSQEYLHFYCDPPLCHRDIKSSNILLDENFVAKVADFGLAHASRSGSISFEPVNTDIRGTPGYMDPEYVVTQELTEKSDVYSYGVLLLELVTGRRAIQESRNLVEWSQKFMVMDSRLPELVDPAITGSFDLEQLQTVVRIVRWCTQREGRARPSIKQVLRLLYERLDPVYTGFVQAVEDEDEGTDCGERSNRGKVQGSDVIFHSGDARCLQSSSSTSRSYCSRSFLLETGSPQSPPGIFSS